ncbi:MAG: hypothetical protein V2J26_04965, partial [Pacificimonas sp.]|nr:hypothetical protein [Pacificimonas sp.]
DTLFQVDYDGSDADYVTVLVLQNVDNTALTAHNFDGYGAGQEVANAPPTAISISGASVSEGAAQGTVVGALSAFDADGDAVSFSIVSGNAGFAILDGNKLSIADPDVLDHETAPTVSLEIEASDGRGGSERAVFEIGVADAFEGGDGPPPDFSGGHFLIRPFGTALTIAGERFVVFGTTGPEVHGISEGTQASFDASVNRGNDVFLFSKPFASYDFSRNASSEVIRHDDGT